LTQGSSLSISLAAIEVYADTTVPAREVPWTSMCGSASDKVEISPSTSSGELSVWRTQRATQTLLHGDPHWWNFLYPHEQTTGTTRILDWGSWRIGVATNDLAYMLALQWYPERRWRLERPLLEHYHQRLIAGGVTGYGWDALWRDYRLSVLWGLIKVARCWAEG
jgi:hypothetical protein